MSSQMLLFPLKLNILLPLGRVIVINRHIEIFKDKIFSIADLVDIQIKWWFF